MKYAHWIVAGLAISSLSAQSTPPDGVPDPSQESPSTHRSVPTGLGFVDSVTGELSLRLGLGPRLPGRVPLGFTWSYDSHSPTHTSIGGEFRL